MYSRGGYYGAIHGAFEEVSESGDFLRDFHTNRQELHRRILTERLEDRIDSTFQPRSRSTAQNRNLQKTDRRETDVFQSLRGIA